MADIPLGLILKLEKLIELLKTPKSSVDVNNLDEVKASLHNELNSLGKSLSANLKPKEAVVMGIKVEEMAELIEQVTALKEAIASVDFNPKIEIIDKVPEITIPEIKLPTINVPQIKIPPINVPAPQVTVNPAEVNIDLDEMLKALEPLKYLSDKPGKPISVRLSDGKSFVEALKGIIDKQEKIVHAFSSSSGMSVDEFKTVAGTPKTFGNFRKEVAVSGTAVQVSATSVPCCDVYLSADIDVGKVLVVGDSTVDATNGNKNGIILIPGNDPVHIRTNDLRNLWVDSDGNGGVLCGNYSAL